MLLDAGIYMVVNGLDLAGTIGMFCASAMFLLLSWVGFRIAQLREKWERENPESATNIKYWRTPERDQKQREKTRHLPAHELTARPEPN